jgi:hypothetical protein
MAMRVYIPEKDCIAVLEISDGEGNDITASYMTGVKNSGLYKATPEVRERYSIEYMMYRDDYNTWTEIVDSLNILISRIYQRGEESPVTYETAISPHKILESPLMAD